MSCVKHEGIISCSRGFSRYQSLHYNFFGKNQAAMLPNDAEIPQAPSETFSSLPIIRKVGLNSIAGHREGRSLSRPHRHGAPSVQRRRDWTPVARSYQHLKGESYECVPNNDYQYVRLIWHFQASREAVSHEAPDLGVNRLRTDGIGENPVHPCRHLRERNISAADSTTHGEA